MRVDGNKKVNMTDAIKDQIIELIQRYGTGEQMEYELCVAVAHVCC